MPANFEIIGELLEHSLGVERSVPIGTRRRYLLWSLDVCPLEQTQPMPARFTLCEAYAIIP